MCDCKCKYGYFCVECGNRLMWYGVFEDGDGNLQGGYFYCDNCKK